MGRIVAPRWERSCWSPHVHDDLFSSPADGNDHYVSVRCDGAAATLGFSAPSPKVATIWWVVTGLLAGAAQLFRLDARLFAAAIGFTMVGYAFIRLRVEGDAMVHFKAVLRHGGIFLSLSW
jgi:uncharacterized membrane protein YphA (DoxX/SURF4 family)